MSFSIDLATTAPMMAPEPLIFVPEGAILDRVDVPLSSPERVNVPASSPEGVDTPLPPPQEELDTDVPLSAPGGDYKEQDTQETDVP
eukprot:15360120-Ditylum_brightwellii.AAC.1